jgi:histidine decarboxylase
MNERLREAIGPYEKHCDGFGNPRSEATRHILTPVIEVAAADPSGLTHGRFINPMTEEIMAYDNAETGGAYIGQINMIVVSSFTNEYIWGYHLVPSAEHPHAGPGYINDRGRVLPICSAEPVLTAVKALFGTKQQKRFPVAAGSMVNAAAKWFEMQGPAHLYASLGIGIVENPSPDAAHLLMEAAGIIPADMTGERVHEFLTDILTQVGERIRDIQYNHGVTYEKILVAWRDAAIPEGHMGCALVAAPYITLAKQAVFRDDGSMRPLETMTLEEWEAEM